MNDSAKQESKLGGHIRNRLLSVFSERIPVDRESVKRRLKEFSLLMGYRIKEHRVNAAAIPDFFLIPWNRLVPNSSLHH